MTIDPLASENPHLSPYNYCANNSLKYVDPTGMVHEISEEAWLAGWENAENEQFNQMAAAEFQIRNGGFDSFMDYVLDVDHGTDFFINDIEQIQLTGIFTRLGSDVELGRQIAQWGHQRLPNALGLGDLRHQVGSFLLASEVGVGTAELITLGNEIYGLLGIDIPAWIRGRSSSAFEWHDVTNNYKGLYWYQGYESFLKPTVGK